MQNSLNTNQVNYNKKNYSLWHTTALTTIALITIFFLWQGFNIFKKTMNAINISNQRIVEKTGIEVAEDLNQDELLNAQKIMTLKEYPKILPKKIRNIFSFDSYANKIIEPPSQEENNNNNE